MRRRCIAAAAAFVAVALAGCAADSSGDPIATPAQPPSVPTGSPVAASPLPTWPTGPELLDSDPAEWDDLTLCLNRTVMTPAGYFLAAGATPGEALRAAVADVRRPLLQMLPDRVARVQLDAGAPALTVVPAAGEQVTAEDVRVAFTALTDIEFDHAAALETVAIAAPEGPSFADQCEVYVEADAIMQLQTDNPDLEPRLVGLVFDIERGIVIVGVTEPGHERFAGLAARTDIVELHQDTQDTGAVGGAGPSGS